MKDLLGYMTDTGAKKQVRWEFVGDIDRGNLAKVALAKIENDERLRNYVLKSLNKRAFDEIRDSVGDSLGTILGGLK